MTVGGRCHNGHSSLKVGFLQKDVGQGPNGDACEIEKSASHKGKDCKCARGLTNANPEKGKPCLDRVEVVLGKDERECVIEEEADHEKQSSGIAQYAAAHLSLNPPT